MLGRQLILLLSILIFGLALPEKSVSAVPDGDMLQQTGECQYNCTANVRVAESLFVVARDSRGQIFHVERIELSPDALLVSSESTAEPGLAPRTQDGGTVDISYDTYETTTQIIVVTTTQYFNADGELVDVSTNEQRFDKETQEQ